jgi:hypothetical protein
VGIALGLKARYDAATLSAGGVILVSDLANGTAGFHESLKGRRYRPELLSVTLKR